MKRMVVFAAMMVLALSTAAQASEAIKNWAAPSSWTPPSAQGASRSALVTYPPLPFIPLDPCRVIDTRLASFPAGYGPPSMAGGGTQRSFTITGQCGIPAGTQAVSFNFAVWAPSTRGDLRVFPAGGPTPTVSTLNWEAGILALANAAVVPLGAGGAITVQIDGPGTVDIFVDINGYYTGSVASGQTFSVTTPGAYAIIGNAAGAGVWGMGGTYGVAGTSSLTAAVYGQASGTAIGVYGTAPTTNGVRGISSGAGVAGVLGQNSNNADGTHGVGGFAGGTGIVYGVQGAISASGAATSAGVHGLGEIVASTSAVRGDVNGITLTDTPGFSTTAGGIFRGPRGVLGYCTNGGGGGVIGGESNAAGTLLQEWGGLAVNGFAVFGNGNGSVTGNFNVGGTLTKAAGSFKIDHPLDPENKYLYHSFVESPDMMNVYNGNIVLNSHGEATVVLPDWFEAVNRDYRYHLTAIGQPSPNLYIAREVDGNVFQIAGGRPGTKVSWTVTGIRHDRFAEAHRIPVEEMKAEKERGLYLHPELFGKPDSPSIGLLKAGPVEKELRESRERDQSR